MRCLSLVRLFFLLAGLYFAVSPLWASCRTFSDWGQCSNYYNGCTHTIEQGGYTVSCQFGSGCTEENTLCSSLRPCKSGCEGATWQYGNEYYSGGYNTNLNDDYCTNANAGCAGVAMYDRLTCGARVVCTDKCEADSVACLSNPEATWNSDNCTCDTLCPPDTIYKCVNTSMGSATFGERPVAHIYKCITTCSSSDQCTRTSELNGTCQDWGWCEDGASSCDIPPDSSNNYPCKRAGGSTTSSNKCYYSCPDGSSLACTPTSTEYVAGAVWVGTCPDVAPESCRPPPPYSSDGGGQSSSSSAPYSSSSSNNDPFSSSTDDPGDDDYTALLLAIRDTLHWANAQRDGISSWGVDYLKDIEDYTLSSWRKTDDIDVKLATFQKNGFNLSQDVKEDLDSARSLLDEINQFLHYDSMRVHGDTSLNPVVRDIRDALTDTALSKSDSLKNAALVDAFKPYMADSGLFHLDGLGGKVFDALWQNFSRDSATSDLCARYNACLSGGGSPAECAAIDPERSCLAGGSPMDGIWNAEISILETIWDGIFGEDSSSMPSDSPEDSTIDLPGYSSAIVELQGAADSLGGSFITDMLESIQSKLDSAKNMNKDSVKIQPDSLWLDSSDASQYVQHVMLPGGTLLECFVCRADLGNFGGLTDTTLKIYIDFADFGGYNWCDIIRAVVKIATLVTCISLTLGSWAAAFGYNPKNDA